MFEIQNYYSFIIAIILFQLFPGAGTIVILSATAKNGLRSGMSAVLGTLTGDIIYMSSAVLGLAAILQNYPYFFKGIQYIGVVYLCFIGLKYLLAKIENEESSKSQKGLHKASFHQALAVCLTNPKAIIFFMAFFPLFLSQESQPITLFLMMLHVTVISLIYQTLLVFIGNSVSKYIKQWKYTTVIATRLAGFALIGFGVKLARNIK
jgi:leucine efflux protein